MKKKKSTGLEITNGKLIYLEMNIIKNGLINSVCFIREMRKEVNMKTNKPCDKCGGRLEFTWYIMFTQDKYQYRCIDCRDWELIPFEDDSLVKIKGSVISAKGRLVSYKK